MLTNLRNNFSIMKHNNFDNNSIFFFFFITFDKNWIDSEIIEIESYFLWTKYFKKIAKSKKNKPFSILNNKIKFKTYDILSNNYSLQLFYSQRNWTNSINFYINFNFFYFKYNFILNSKFYFFFFNLNKNYNSTLNLFNKTLLPSSLKFKKNLYCL